MTTTSTEAAPRRLQDLRQLRPWLNEQGRRRVLLLTGKSRRFTDEVLEALSGLSVEVFDEATSGVPEPVVERAREALEKTRADAIVALGGGAAIGLGKALRLVHDVPFAAIPTSYAGSELTRIWGVSQEAGRSAPTKKRTGRDERVRPDAVVYDLRFTRGMPKAFTVASLLNALAHPVSALSTETLRPSDEDRAEKAIGQIVRALLHLVHDVSDDRARVSALEGAIRAGEVLDAGALGLHHRVVHQLAVVEAEPAAGEGHRGPSHAALHGVLLPHFVRSLDPDLAARVGRAAGAPDLPALLFDVLRRAGAATSLRALGLGADPLLSLVEAEELPRYVGHAWLGIRPSLLLAERRAEAGSIFIGGAPLESAERVVIALHERGGDAGRIAEEARAVLGDDPRTAVLAPQAPRGEWFGDSHRVPASALGPALVRALDLVDAAIALALDHADNERVFLFGFSQGACLAAEVFARSGHRLGGLVALTGARIGPPNLWTEASADLSDVPVLLGASAADRYVAAADVERTARFFSEEGARVTTLVAPGDGHEIRARERILARALLLGEPPEGTTPPRGYPGPHESEALPGALPREQNNPRHAPYGLYAEQVSGSAFTAPRRANRRVWLYRVRPSTQHGPFAPLEHPTFRADFEGAPVDPNLAGYRPLSIPDEPCDFVDGIATIAGAGSAALRRGAAVHAYAANRSMEHRAFADHDGELLLVPQEGALVLVTELGILEVRPGQIALLPRGIQVSVLLEGPSARGFLGEVFGRSFRLPERGPVGANGLVDERHFEAPSAYFEDRLDPGHRLTVKLGGRLFDAAQDYAPFDVVAWHGNHLPFVYDLGAFSPVANVQFDHADPSVFTVLTAPLDEEGANGLDFLFFPARWDATEHTFRPPYFHRNATYELNGIVYDDGLSGDGPFQEGGYFLTPPLTAHGVAAHTAEHAFALSDEAADKPARRATRSLWFQLESALPLALTPWARSAPNRIASWPVAFGQHRARFDPRSGR